MDKATIVLIGAVGGTLLGVLGGVYGTRNSIKQTNGPRERAFVKKMALLYVIMVSTFVALVFLLPDPWNQYIWLPYGLWLNYTIRRSSRKQQAIREAEPKELDGAVEAFSTSTDLESNSHEMIR
ncbi:hypothetical protein [uncultured Gimesia sp.]|uniref:hypothetical protein n=1 Tax=uncultured Gimesia sp. TaxID=1678688 RepID=UPI0030DB08D5|tara:strand:- start:5170 stop:5541 length:372 start_codon:yes stop_codon:yes gene_type:complete